MDKDWGGISFLHRGKHRKKILKLLEKPQTPTQVKEQTNLHFNIVSRTILQLEKKGFVECLNPQEKLGRFYRITDSGRRILAEVEF